MMTDLFMLGTTVVGMVEIPEPRWFYRDCQKVIPLQSGGVRKLGKPSVIWRYGFVTNAEREVLRTICPTGSAWVYVNTRTLENVVEFKTFYASMVWPPEEDPQNLHVLDFILTFRFMIIAQ
jgi:hypothetical protein